MERCFEVERWKGEMVERCLLFYNLSRMFLKRLDPGSLPGMTRFLVWGWFVSWAAEVCSAEATELPVWERPPVSVANGLCHPSGMPRFGACWYLFRLQHDNRLSFHRMKSI